MKRIGGVVIQERMGLRRLQLMRSGNRQSRRGQPRTKCNGCVEPHAESVTIAKLIGRCCSDRTVRSDDAGKPSRLPWRARAHPPAGDNSQLTVAFRLRGSVVRYTPMSGKLCPKNRPRDNIGSQYGAARSCIGCCRAAPRPVQRLGRTRAGNRSPRRAMARWESHLLFVAACGETRSRSARA